MFKRPAFRELYKQALQPALKLIDRFDSAPCEVPTPTQESTRFPEFSWDLRTIIAVFPEDAPFRFLNLNILVGLTGMRFDRTEQWTGSDPKDAVDLQFCLAGRNRSATQKRYFSISRDLSYEPDSVRFELADRLRFDGRWPSYHIEYRQPEADLALTMELETWPGFIWWAYAPRIYCHYTSFCTCKLSYKWSDEAGEIVLPALHDHGWGGNLLPLQMPLSVFRYEVLRLPNAGFGISLRTEAATGLALRNVGAIRWDEGRRLFMPQYDCHVLDWDVFENYAGQPRRIPRRWNGHQRGPEGSFDYVAERKTEPHPIFGDGFMCGFDYEGRFRGVLEKTVSGEGYVEQLGNVPRVI